MSHISSPTPRAFNRAVQGDLFNPLLRQQNSGPLNDLGQLVNNDLLALARLNPRDKNTQRIAKGLALSWYYAAKNADAPAESCLGSIYLTSGRIWKSMRNPGEEIQPGSVFSPFGMLIDLHANDVYRIADVLIDIIDGAGPKGQFGLYEAFARHAVTHVNRGDTALSVACETPDHCLKDECHGLLFRF